MSELDLKRPSVPTKCAPDAYRLDKTLILDDVRQAIQARGWECKDLHQQYASIRRKAFERLMDGEDYHVSIRFAYDVAEDPAKSLARRVKEHRERLSRPFGVEQSVARTGKNLPARRPWAGDMGSVPLPVQCQPRASGGAA